MTVPPPAELQALPAGKQPQASGAAPGLRFAAIMLLTVIVYLPALRGGFIWDDHSNITDNQLLHTWSGLKNTWVQPRASFQYYPLTYTAFWGEYHLFGLDPAGYHAVNLLLHALNAFLVGLLLSRLAVPGAWLAAILFAVHPVQVESVAWITELKNVLSGFFFLSAFLLFLRFHQGGGDRWRFYVFSFLVYLCALASKTSTVALPVAILLVLWWKQDRVNRRDILLLVPFLVAGAAFALSTVWLEQEHVGAQGPDWQLSVGQRFQVAGRVVWFAAGKFIWPHPLMFIYPRWNVDPTVWWQYLFPLATIAVLLVLWIYRKRTGKGLLAAALFFVGTTAPVPAAFNLFFMRYSYVADHFYYLAGIAFVALMGAAMHHLLSNRKSLLAMAVPVVAVLVALSWQRCQAFRSEETVWRDTLAQNPEAWLAYGNLGVLLAHQGKLEEAVVEYKAALRIRPDNVEARYDLGTALFQLGRLAEAADQFEEVLRIQPKHCEARNNLGNVLVRQGKLAEAIGQYKKALRLNPGYAPAHYNLGVVLLQLGKVPEATKLFERAVRLKPDYAEAHNNLGYVLLKQGRVHDSQRHFEKVLRIAPDMTEAHYNLGNVRLQLGDPTGAIRCYKQALRRKPDYADAHNSLGVALFQQGRLSEAKQQFEETLRLQPDHITARSNLIEMQTLQATAALKN